MGLRNDLIIVGYFNLGAFDWQNICALNNSANYPLLLALVHDNFLIQLVNCPTREENILDLVLVSAPGIADNLFVGNLSLIIMLAPSQFLAGLTSVAKRTR